MYTCAYACSIWHQTRGLVNVSGIPDCFFAFMKTAFRWLSLVHVWDVIIIICFRGASGGSTPLTLAFHCIDGVTKVTQHHLHGYGHPDSPVALCAFTLGM